MRRLGFALALALVARAQMLPIGGIPISSGAAPTTAIGYRTASSGGITSTMSIAGPPAASLIVILCAASGVDCPAAATQFGDTHNTYTLAGQDTSQTIRVSIYYKCAPDTTTTSWSSSSSGSTTIWVAAYTGITGCYDTGTFHSSTMSNPVSMTPSAAHDLIVTGMGDFTTYSGRTVGTPITRQLEQASTATGTTGAFGDDWDYNSTSAITASWANGGMYYFVAVVAGFKK